MQELYCICNLDRYNNKLCYETGEYSFHGHIIVGDILHAKMFDSLQDACRYIAESGSKFYLGCSIIQIADVTLEKIKLDVEHKDYKLYDMYHDPTTALS